MVNLIDVLWSKEGTNRIECAFEVEETSSFYSGLLRLKDLIYSLSLRQGLFRLDRTALVTKGTDRTGC